jgi:hypothetical protein
MRLCAGNNQRASSGNGNAVLYFTCLSAKLDLMFLDHGIIQDPNKPSAKWKLQIIIQIK